MTDTIPEWAREAVNKMYDGIHPDESIFDAQCRLVAATAARVERETREADAYAAYVSCSSTRHVTLGCATEAAILALPLKYGETR